MTPAPLRALTRTSIGFVLAVLVAASPARAQESEGARVDSIFADYAGTAIPGCAVAVSDDHRIVLSEAFGMADLEHDVVNTPETRFEAGSVSKQFTAAATILLALEGAIDLDDDVREYFPELPDYGETITIRHLLNHTSGLRDWGSVASIHGWPRTTRVHTHVHALDIAARQRELNYPPGLHYSYTNTGYNLQAMLVERVTGVPFAEFTRERLFEPLGMSRTEWRDDYTRVVKDRAIAYRPGRDAPGAFHMDMPFENVHGNGGLLTTVGDLLRWTWNLETGEVGGPRFLEEMHRQGVLRTGRTIDYASGLFLGTYRGLPEIQHGGATAGYRAFLTRFPDQGVAVSLLCNRADASSGGLAHRVADVFLAEEAEPRPGPEGDPAIEVEPSVLEALAGTYRNTRTHEALRLVVEEGRLLYAGRFPLEPVSETAFRLGSGQLEVFPRAEAGERGPLLRISGGDTVRYEPTADFDPSPAEMEEYEGSYHSPEAEATYEVVVEDGRLALRDRYGETLALAPVYPDAFSARGRTFRFLRDDGDRVDEMRWSQSRVWDLRFDRRR